MDIGIDLGTTYSAVARVNEKGEPEILENREGERLTPSAVYFQENGEVVVGSVAKQYALLYPDRVVTNVKDHMGTGRVYTIDGKTYRPEDISALILKKLIQDAEARTGEKAERVVVTIPAYFSDAQRTATLDAAQMAGLKCRQILNEPTAAAVAFAHSGKLGSGKLLVYDLGGGTFDVSIIQQEGEEVKVLSTGGYSELGGHFFDAAIRDAVSDWLLSGTPSIDLEGDPAMAAAYQELTLKAEEAKKRLSSVERSDLLLTAAGGPKLFPLSRTDYEAMILPFCQRTEAKVKQVMAEAGVTFADLDQVLLVGGSSRTPLIQRRLEALCGKPPARTVNPDEAVALGAALCAGSLRYVRDVCSRSIGVVSYDHTADREAFYPIIRRNTLLPAKGVHGFCTAQATDCIILKVAESEGDAQDMAAVEVLNDYGIHLGREVPELTDVDVGLELDENQILHIFVECTRPVAFRQEYRLDRSRNLADRERLAKTALIARTTVV